MFLHDYIQVIQSWLEYCRSDAVPFSGYQPQEWHFKVTRISCTSSSFSSDLASLDVFASVILHCDGYQWIICQFHLSLLLPFPTPHLTRIKSSSLLSLCLLCIDADPWVPVFSQWFRVYCWPLNHSGAPPWSVRALYPAPGPVPGHCHLLSSFLLSCIARYSGLIFILCLPQPWDQVLLWGALFCFQWGMVLDIIMWTLHVLVTTEIFLLFFQWAILGSMCMGIHIYVIYIRR